ncbi:hypothetical protein FD01_GL001212 [Lacticaseibacillus manihotivorans DSM 13343 = JCM 12514]|jgi:uncharacterized protein YeaO (DUF488 family)|uniref:Uroporphyrin-III C-methyltransferase n=2 Tax=Lacticaseibacillus manihotivorans TaxID=88233 RepID=A0A0R1QIF0_9LACO|nr:hypothetical protein FD01_GL001212 [Lacticaseibacillus manihotivorans DSM 13343 = JCM 12514]
MKAGELMEIIPMRIYAHDQPAGLRLLVDRVWPRGVSKVNAALDDWTKTIAPSTELRKWFGHDPEKFAEFTTRYRAELDANPDTPAFVTQVATSKQPVLLLFGAKDEAHNNAVVLKTYLEEKLSTRA